MVFPVSGVEVSPAVPAVVAFMVSLFTSMGGVSGAFLTSLAGVFFYSVIPAKGGLSTAPDWFLGFLFGFGGFAGMYCGARLQKYVPQKLIKPMLGLVIVSLALRYVFHFFTS